MERSQGDTNEKSRRSSVSSSKRDRSSVSGHSSTSSGSSDADLLKEAEDELKRKRTKEMSCSSSPVSPAGEDTPADFFGDLKQKMVHIKV